MGDRVFKLSFNKSPRVSSYMYIGILGAANDTAYKQIGLFASGRDNPKQPFPARFHAYTLNRSLSCTSASVKLRVKLMANHRIHTMV